MDQVGKLLDTLTQAVSQQYQSRVAPGVTISYLPNKQYYVSILKYGSSHLDKTVMHAAKSAKLEDALMQVIKEFLAQNAPAPSPIEQLKELCSFCRDLEEEEENECLGCGDIAYDDAEYCVNCRADDEDEDLY